MIVFAVSGFLLAGALWLSMRGPDPFINCGFETDPSSWAILHFRTIDPIEEGGLHEWDVLMLGPVWVAVRTTKRDDP